MKKNPRNKKRILIVDDHPMMREGLAQLINHEPDLTVSAQADDAAQALNSVASRVPDLVLVDISLPDRNGIELIKDIHTLHTGLPVLVVSMHDESIYAERVLRAGGRGYIMKQEGGKKLMQAIRQVLNGQIYVSEKMASKILEIFSGGRTQSDRPNLERLSDREFEVFQFIGQGQGTRQIADLLHLSVKTVEVHRANIKKKLALQTGPDLVRYAIRWTEAHQP
ncbi:MAG TPA: response regulator transcription factor [Candidatus Sulfotelmatobacter sp.]|nr:response regulator transcription factor [Candidatus Sulfotelmatobacter sp.]HWI60149.1 response regulator transcription factor [Bacillota bacterium]